MVVLCPSRGRPDKAAEMVASFRETTLRLDTTIVVVVDIDDPTLDGYTRHWPLGLPDRPYIMVLRRDETGDLVRATNTAASRVWHDDDIIGHVGDDHRFRTVGWDRAITEALASPGIAYGDDGHQRARLPTAVFMSAVIPRTLGWYALPGAHHLYIDRAWKTIGEVGGFLRYLPAVSIEHVHPMAGKADWDDGYRSANAPEMYAHDKAAYQRWIAGRMEADMGRVQAALRVAA
jgi:hypothetical protein